MAPRILDFTDGFTSSSAPATVATPASTIAFTPYGHISSTNVQDALEEIIDEKVLNITSTDNAVVKFDGVTGDIQDTGILIDDSNNVTFVSQIRTQKQDVASSATIVQLSSAKSFVRITGATATEIQGILAGQDGQIITIHNSASAIVTFKHEDAAASASDRMKFVDGEDIEVDPDSSIELIYDITQARWVIKSGAGTTKLVGYQEIPIGLINGANMNFQIAQEPLNEDSVQVFVDNLILENTYWSLSSTTITLTFAPAFGQSIYVFYLTKGTPNAAPPVPSGTEQVVYRDITALEETNTQLTLSVAPADPTKVKLDIIGGTSQRYGVDFIVSGSDLIWTGLRLDGFLIEDDEVRITYFS
jgi:hypothetical protein